MLLSVFSSALNTDNLYSLIVKILPFVTREILLSGSLSLIILSTSIRAIYAKYLNNQMDVLEKEKVNFNQIQSNVCEDDNEKESDYDNQKILDYYYSNTFETEKKLIKVYKK